ncbi:hypothetical protein AB0P41_35725 [Streptomyces sp. NPDC079167]|uniref:hypothetical protein n=1 Tax=Streptomyces sp. NPDC079167 TaxID=3154513 RepID=UPI0034472EC0
MATYDQLTEWAGPEHVTRAGRDIVAAWRIPEFMKTQLVEWASRWLRASSSGS